MTFQQSKKIEFSVDFISVLQITYITNDLLMCVTSDATMDCVNTTVYCILNISLTLLESRPYFAQH